MQCNGFLDSTRIAPANPRRTFRCERARARKFKIDRSLEIDPTTVNCWAPGYDNVPIKNIENIKNVEKTQTRFGPSLDPLQC